jgi:hypothetical protein
MMTGLLCVCLMSTHTKTHLTPNFQFVVILAIMFSWVSLMPNQTQLESIEKPVKDLLEYS